MKAIRADYKILTPISCPMTGTVETQFCAGVTKTDYYHQQAGEELRRIEAAARTCYKSEDASTEMSEPEKIRHNESVTETVMDDYSSAVKLVKKLIDCGHEAMLEHSLLSVKFICDRALSHELVRHRMASFAQESQRYCNYSKDKFEGNVTFIMPPWMDADGDDLGYVTWKEACLDAEKAYFDLLNSGYKPEQARCVLPNTVKTEIVVTANYREWRHIFKLRTSRKAHPDMRDLMLRLLNELTERIPVIFDDIAQEANRKQYE